MFVEYLDKLQARERPYFTSEEIRNELGTSDFSARSGLYRLKKRKKIINPINGLYVIIPPEHRPYGSIPAEELVPIIMQHLKANYYVGLLSSGLFLELLVKNQLVFR
jgi:predicted transcriptional regulator of viral defense system